MTAPFRLCARFERTRVTPRGEVQRFYVVSVEPQRQLSLVEGSSSGFDLVITRGRIGGPRKPTTKVVTLPSLPAAVERWGVLCARRRSRGYVQRTEQ